MKSNRLPLTIFLLAVVPLNVLADSEIYNSRLISACRNSPGFKIMSYVHIKKCLMYIDQRMQYMKAQEYCENFENPAFIATFKNAYEFQLVNYFFFYANLSKEYYAAVWVGLDRLQDKRYYRWIDDGTPYADFNTDLSQDNFSYDCTLLISSTMIMHPMLCNANFQFFCEVR
ncbi:uncharacterized protein LOC129921675 isoform X2 [Biomphalaria glabrata]|uniref:Uncharacterized protein LOC129921675 isoform X2 n=1 Tax=Biomphalaria glabrata TaxID=6526 RepID=A0A9W2YBC3_BIOGL|nr:uncharacterized protein LOC129921675 isoform X2 [Biomphalaria glabrata]XP_055860018.1 uncharacterized protein LOC129921675 isoform X2 [Biomphalaria glabrata]